MISVPEVENTYCPDDVFMEQEKWKEIIEVLKYKKNIILQGAPGVGKTYIAEKLAGALMKQGHQKCVDKYIKKVQFHQNYSYEDFIQGYKPSSKKTDKGKTKYELQEGEFYKFCKLAQDHKDEKFFFIIDEINRGNMSKIFGELLMLIEKDYRGEEHGITLAYDENELDKKEVTKFYVPENVYIIGMMNTAHRGLSMIDYALRRRFSFVEVESAIGCSNITDIVSLIEKRDNKSIAEVIEGKTGQTGKINQKFAKCISDKESGQLTKLTDKVCVLNQVIQEDPALGKGFSIGHSYFCGKESAEQIVKYSIMPLLNEYWDDKKLVKEWEEFLMMDENVVSRAQDNQGKSEAKGWREVFFEEFALYCLSNNKHGEKYKSLGLAGNGKGPKKSNKGCYVFPINGTNDECQIECNLKKPKKKPIGHDEHKILLRVDLYPTEPKIKNIIGWDEKVEEVFVQNRQKFWDEFCENREGKQTNFEKEFERQYRDKFRDMDIPEYDSLYWYQEINESTDSDQRKNPVKYFRKDFCYKDAKINDDSEREVREGYFEWIIKMYEIYVGTLEAIGELNDTVWKSEKE